MKTRPLLLAVLGILLCAGLISSAYASAITRDLMMPRTGGQSTTPPALATVPLTPKSPTVTKGPAQTLARDTFQRANQALWGMATDGQNWEGDANTAPLFSIVNGLGQIAGSGGTFSAVLGPTSPSTDVLLSATASTFDGGKVNIGAVVRWNDSNNWYKALIDGTQLAIIKHIHGIGQSLVTIPFVAHGGIVYSVRIHAQGTTLSAKVWPATTAEPANWMLVTTDASLLSGRGGIRIVAQNNATIRVSNFLETSANA